MAENVKIDGLVEQRQELERLMVGSPDMEKRLQKLIRKVLQSARQEISRNIKGDIASDPRKAYKAVKTAVYKRILGGSVSILNKRRASGGRSTYEPPRTLQAGQYGGNRRTRSQRTKDIMSYTGADRAFILRFLNAGVQNRTITFSHDSHRSDIRKGSRGGNVSKYGETVNTGRRGNIAPRNFFGTSSHKAMQQAAQQLSDLIDDMIKKEFS